MTTFKYAIIKHGCMVSYEHHWYQWYGMGIYFETSRYMYYIQFIAAKNMPTPIESRKKYALLEFFVPIVKCPVY